MEDLTDYSSQVGVPFRNGPPGSDTRSQKIAIYAAVTDLTTEIFTR